MSCASQDVTSSRFQYQEGLGPRPSSIPAACSISFRGAGLRMQVLTDVRARGNSRFIVDSTSMWAPFVSTSFRVCITGWMPFFGIAQKPGDLA